MKQNAIDSLRRLQFTEYEAKAYLALLEKAPMTGYGVALHSGVPRSKIYEVLGGMASRGDVMVSREETPQYYPLPPKELVEQRKQRAEDTFQSAEESLERYTALRSKRENIWNIAGAEAILGKACEIINAAQYRVLLEMWTEEAALLREALSNAAARGCKVQIIAYGEMKDYQFAEVAYHDTGDEITDEYGGRWIVCSVDDHEVVAGIVSMKEESRAAWTTHPGLVMPITEVIIHDLYVHEILTEFRPQLEEKFGAHLELLRKKYSIAGKSKRYFDMVQDVKDFEGGA